MPPQGAVPLLRLSGSICVYLRFSYWSLPLPPRGGAAALWLIALLLLLLSRGAPHTPGLKDPKVEEILKSNPLG